MQYNTIVLELLQQEYPILHRQLGSSRMLLSTIDLKSSALRRYHEYRMDRLSQARPDLDAISVASQSLELAIQDLRDDLRSSWNASEAGPDGLSPDEAMTFVRRLTPSE